MKLRSLTLLLGLFILASSCNVGKQAVTTDPTSNVEFTILHLNDVYEIAPLEGGKAGGLARVATVKKQLLQENPNTIAVIAGDFLSPSLIGTLKKEDGERIAGQQMVETFNVMGMDYATFGNHEFDLKSADLLQNRINQSAFEYVACNVLRADGAQKRPFVQEINGEEQPIPEYIIREFTNGKGEKVRVGIIGVVLPFNQADYVSYEPVTEAFKAAYEEVKPQTDLVAALTHLNVDEDLELAREVPGVLLFMGGHDHVNMNHYVENTVITKADANAKSVYIHRVVFNPASGLSRVRSTLKRIDNTIPDDPATQEVVNKWQGDVDAIMRNMGYLPDEQVLFSEVPLECKEVDIRNRQANYGRITVDAFSAAWPGADVYLVNSGSMRMDDNIEGIVTQYDVLRTFPFGGAITWMEIPGEVLAKTLDTGLEKNRGEGGYFQIKNVEKDMGQWLINGEALIPAKAYKVVLPEFVAQGNEANLGFLGEHQYQEKEELMIGGKAIRNDVRDLVIAYMKSL